MPALVVLTPHVLFSRSLSLSLSIYLSIYLSISQCVYSVIVQLRVVPKAQQLELLRKNHEDAVFRFRFRTIDKINVSTLLRGNPDTVVELAKKRVTAAGEVWVTVYRSHPVRNSLLPSWDEADVDLETMCNGDLVSEESTRTCVHRV